MGGNRGRRGGSVACGEYVMVPPGLVTTMCVFPFISSETCHIMGLNTGYINSGTETKQKCSNDCRGYTIDVEMHSDVGSIKKRHIRPMRVEKKHWRLHRLSHWAACWFDTLPSMYIISRHTLGALRFSKSTVWFDF